MFRRMRSPELARLLRQRPRFSVFTSISQVAAALWDLGEDEVAARAIVMAEKDLAGIERICAWYESPQYPLPMSGQRITHRHVTAFAAITYFEGAVRPLTRTRRRPERNRPSQYTPLPPDPGR